jgi:hypothetical protein
VPGVELSLLCGCRRPSGVRGHVANCFLPKDVMFCVDGRPVSNPGGSKSFYSRPDGNRGAYTASFTMSTGYFSRG